MSNDSTSKRCSLFLYPEDSDTPSAAVHVDVSGDTEAFLSSIDMVLRTFETFSTKPLVVDYMITSLQGTIKKVVGEEEEEHSIFCMGAQNSELELILSVLYASVFPSEGTPKFSAAIKEISYQGERYTDISDIKFLGDDCINQIFLDNGYSMLLKAKKDGRSTLVYFLARPVYVVEDTDGSKMLQLGNYVPGSCGVVETGDNLQYVGAFPLIEMLEHPEKFYNFPVSDYDDDDPEAGPRIRVYSTADLKSELRPLEDVYCTYVHVFSEAKGDDIVFHVLYNGKLYQKISSNAGQVIFHHTGFYSSCLNLLKGEPDEREDIIFQNTGGQYQYTVENQNSGRSLFRGVTFTPPQLPNPDSMDQAALHKLFWDYVTALYAAFSGAEEYTAGEYVFHRAEEGGLVTQFQGFALAVKFIPSHVNDWCTLFEDLGNPYYNFANPYTDMYSLPIDIEAISFTEDGVTVKLIPKGEDDFEIDVNHNRSTFSELSKRHFFAGVDLPETIELEWTFDFFLEEKRAIGAILQAVKQAIVECGVGRFSHFLYELSKEGSVKPNMERKLYDEGMTVDPEIVSFAVELWNQFDRTGRSRIPNLAIIGEAGTGKSTMVHKLAKAVYGMEVMECGPSDLKPNYLGQTKGVVVKQLLEAAKGNKILFIDEAYELMTDDYGREAVSFLLPLMTGGAADRPKVEATIKNDSGEKDITISLDFEEGVATEGKKTFPISKRVPPIWIAGYEDDIRLMLKENQGLFRRFKRAALKAPTTNELYGELIKKLKANLAALSEEESPEKKADLDYRFNVLLKQFEDNQTLIKNFFRWGAQPQNSKYFAHHAGAASFLERCIDGIDFAQPEKNITVQIEKIIIQTKRDVQNQLDAVRLGSGGGTGADQIEMIFENEITFDSLIGCEDQVAELNTLIDMLVNKLQYQEQGITVPKGALLLGPSGVGKTFSAWAMAGQLQKRFDLDESVGFMALSAPELISKPISFIGRVFEKAEKYTVCLIFIDEVDAIARNRYQSDCYPYFLELIKQIDKIEQRSNIFVLAATRTPELLDSSLTRAGRIDRELYFSLPNHDARRTLTEKSVINRCGALKNFTCKKKENGEIQLGEEDEKAVRALAKEVAAITSSFSHGDIENIINTAFIRYKQGDDWKGGGQAMPDFENGELNRLYRIIDDVVEDIKVGVSHPKGKEDFSVVKNNQSRSSTAIHEVGHALVSILCGCEFEKITSLPRGGTLGYVRTQFELLTKRDFENRIRICMGGRLAEEIVYGKDEISAGASADMLSATNLARYMVERIGFAEEFEFMTLLWGNRADRYSCSETFREQSDRVVNDLLKKLYQETREMLQDKRELIITLAEEVFNCETMKGEDFTAFYRSKVKD